MPQEKECIGSYVEYPGGIPWQTYAYRCPICQELTDNVGLMDRLVDGEWHRVCINCEEQQSFEEEFAREDDYLYEGEGEG